MLIHLLLLCSYYSQRCIYDAYIQIWKKEKKNLFIKCLLLYPVVSPMELLQERGNAENGNWTGGSRFKIHHSTKWAIEISHKRSASSSTDKPQPLHSSLLKNLHPEDSTQVLPWHVYLPVCSSGRPRHQM